MPLNVKGKKILAAMQKEYGKEKGKNVYFATIRKKAMAESYDKKKD